MKKTSLIMALSVSLVASVLAEEAPESKSDAVTFLEEGKTLSAQMIQSTGPLLKSHGSHAVLGRDFIKEDFEKHSTDVAIISFSVWAAATRSRPDIIGRKIRAGGRELVVIAVAPKSPAALEGMKVWFAAK